MTIRHEQSDRPLSQQELKESVQYSLHSARRDVGRYGLSATVSIMVSVSSYPVAYAHTGAGVMPPVVPAVHAAHVAPTITASIGQSAANIVAPTHVHHSSVSAATAPPSASNTVIQGTGSGVTTAAATGGTTIHQPAHQNNSSANALSAAASSASGRHTKHSNAATAPTGNISNLNLGSAKQDMSASLLGNFQTLTLNIGGKTDVVSMSSKLTDAEFIAAQQVLNGGNAAGAQTISLNARGTANGGTINLNNGLLTSLNNSVGGTLTSLTIPKQLTVDDSVSSLNLSGAFNNRGAVVLQPASGSSESISASIVNNSGSISGKNVDLTLNASSIINSGTIQTGSNVTINGGQINNAGGTISAANTVNVSNSGGVDIKGGNIFSQTLNLNAGSKDLNVSGTNITGVVNDTAGNAHINATSQNFQLGVSNVTNDPLYSTTGNFIITNSITPTSGADLSIVAGGNIYSASNASLNTSATTGNGGNLLLVAGADFSVGSFNNLTINHSLTAGGGSATGGSIDLTGSQTGGAPITAINTSTSDAAGTGGNVTMVAYAGSAADSGRIALPTNVTIRTGNDGAAQAGNVNIIAGGTSGTSISLGNIDASSTNAASAANVSLATAKPAASGVVIDANGKQTSGSWSATLAHLQPADISIGNINVNSGSTSGPSTSVNISSGGAVSFNNIDVSGYGGLASVGSSGVGAAGGNGGAVTINAKNGITGSNIFTYGGGGAGGGTGSNGFDGGAGGSGGSVLVATSTGDLSLSGMVNVSGGGGGGGGAADTPSTSGSGGTGGSSASAFLTANKGSISVTQGIFAVDGGDGGHGDTVSIFGGGGGGSYGGGGGAGGSDGPQYSRASGGGGGLWGGGGAGAGADTGHAGGGGGAGMGGLGGGDSSSNGGYTLGGTQGGLGAVSIGMGGTNQDGFNGSNVINDGDVSGNGIIALNGSTGIGTAAAPQQILAPNVSLLASSGSIYVSSQAGTFVNALNGSKTGTISITAAGDLAINSAAPTNAGTVVLTVIPPSGGTNTLAVASDITAGKSITLNNSGQGTISSIAALTSPLLSANADSGSIFLASSGAPGKLGGIEFSSNGAVQIFETGNINLLASTAQSLVANSFDGSLTVSGSVQTQTTAQLSAFTGMNFKAQVSAPSQLTLNLSLGKIIAPGGITNSGVILINAAQSDLGNLTVNTSGLVVVAHSASITDMYTGPTQVGATGGANATNFVFNTAASLVDISYPTGVTGFNNITINNTSATGSILIDRGVEAFNTVSLSTVGGDMTSASGPFLVAPTVKLTTQSGNILGPGNGFGVDAQNLTVSASSTKSNVQLYSDQSIAITKATANEFSLLSSGQINLNGAVAANKVSLNGADGILQTSSAGTVTANQISLGSADSAVSSKGLVIALTGANSLLTIDGTNDNIQSAGAINLGQVTVAQNLQIISGGGITQTDVIAVTGNATLQGTSFTQNKGETLNAVNLSITATEGTANSVVLDGDTNVTNVSVSTPVNGAITVGPGATVQFASTGTFTTSKLTLQGSGATAGLIASNLNTGTVGPGSLDFKGAGSGDLTLGGTGTIGGVQSLTFISNKDLTIGSGISFAVPSVSEVIYAKGAVDLPTNNISVSPGFGGSGGNLQIAASNLLINGVAVSSSNPLVLNANADPSSPLIGNGGSIALTLTGKAAATVGGPNSEYTFNAAATSPGGNGGSIYFQNGGAITVADTSSLDIAVDPNGSAFGGNITLIAGGNLVVNGNLTTPVPTGSQSYGSITLSSGGTTPFSVNESAAPTNGVSGTIIASNITITDKAGISFGTNAGSDAIFTAGVLSTVTLNTNNLTFGTGAGVVINGILSINAPGNLTITGVTNSTFVGGGPETVAVNAVGSFAAPIQLVGTAVDTNQHNLTLITGGTLTLPALPWNMIAVAPYSSGNAGSITIQADAVKGISGALNLVAEFNGTFSPPALYLPGTAGSVSYTITGTQNINLGGANSTLNIDIGPQGGFSPNAPQAGNGVVNVSTGGNLVVDTTGSGNGITTNNGGPYIGESVINLSGKNLLVTNAAVPGLNNVYTQLSLSSNSSTAFALGGGTVAKNGIDLQGSGISVNSLTLTNTGGGVALNDNATATSLTVVSRGNITQASGTALTAYSYSLHSLNGNIGTASNALALNSNANALVALVTDSKTGIINVTDAGDFTDTLTAATGGSKFEFSSFGGLTTAASITATNVSLSSGFGSGNLTLGGTVGNGTGTVVLTSANALSQTLGIVDAKTLSFTVGTMATPLVTNATTIAASSATGSTPTINIVDTNQTTVTVQGLSTTNSSGDISVTTGGNLVVTGAIGTGNAGDQQSLMTVLSAGGDSSITTKGAGLIGGANLTLTAKNLGSESSALQITSPKLYINATGLVNINATGVNPSQLFVLGSNVTVSSFKLTADGRIYISPVITSTGDITIKNVGTPSRTDLGGISTQGLVSLNGDISLTSLDTHQSSIDVYGNLTANNVKIDNATTLFFSNFDFSGTVGNGKGTVTIDSGIIYTTASAAEIEGTTLNFAAGGAFGLAPGSPINVSVAKINQTTPSSIGFGVAFADSYSGNVTVSNLKDTAGGNITITAANGMTVGKVSTTGAVDLEAGGSLLLKGNVGDPTGNSSTTLVAGKGSVGGSTLSTAGGVKIYGQSITLANTGGGIYGGTPSSSIATYATTALTTSSGDQANISNHSGGSVVTADVLNSFGLNLVNTSTTGGGLTVLEAQVNTALSITSHGGALTLGGNSGGVFTSGGNMTFVSTGTGADGNVDVSDGVSITSGGALTITSGAGASRLQIGLGGGAGSMITANGVSLSSADKTGTADILIGDSITITSTGKLSIVSPTSLSFGENFTSQATSSTFNAKNGVLGTLDNFSVQGQTGVSILSGGTNGGIIIGSNTISVLSNNPINISTSGALNIGSANGDTNISTVNGGDITLTGASVSLGYGTGVPTSTTVSGGNVTISATGLTGGGVTYSSSNGINTITASKDLTITSKGSGGDIAIGDDNSMSATGTLKIGTSAVNVANIDIGNGATLSGGATTIQASGSVTVADGAHVSSQSVDVRNNSLNIGAGTDITIGDAAALSAGGSVNLQSTTGSITLGTSGGATGANLTAYNGDVSVKALSNSGSISLEDNSSIDANSVFANMGNVTLQAGTGTTPLSPLAAGLPGLTVNGTPPLVNTFSFSGPVTFNTESAQITLNNQTTSASGINFAGNNTITADPPAGAINAPRTVLEAAMPHFDMSDAAVKTTGSLNNTNTLMAVGAANDPVNANNSFVSSNALTVVAPAVHSLLESPTEAANVKPSSLMVTTGSISQSGETFSAGVPSSVYTGSAPANSSAPNSALQAAFNNLNAGNALANVQGTGRLQSVGFDGNISAAVAKSGDASVINASTRTVSGGVSVPGKQTRHAQKDGVLTSELRNGATLVAPDRPTVLTTPSGNVSVGSRAVALVVSNENGLHVFNLDDCRRDSVTVNVNGESICLVPGAHITITSKNVQSFDQVNPAQYIAYRAIRSRDLNGELRAFHSQFNHLSAINGLEPLRNLMKSPDPAMRKIGQHMLKTTALLQMMNMSPAPYELQQAPAMTAMQQ